MINIQPGRSYNKSQCCNRSYEMSNELNNERWMVGCIANLVVKQEREVGAPQCCLKQDVAGLCGWCHVLQQRVWRQLTPETRSFKHYRLRLYSIESIRDNFWDSHIS